MSDERPAKAPAAGAPAWVTTFADLMSLLMCFFVLLLAFSEMDVLKFKQLAGSMKLAFGVQREIKAKEIPKGTSVIAKEFSPGRPEPTVLNEVRQHTTDDLQRQMEVGEAPQESKVDGEAGEHGGKPAEEPSDQDRIEEKIKIVEVPVDPPEADATELRLAFADEIEGGLIDVLTDERRVIIRIQEKGAFPSGSATMIALFEPVLTRIGEVVSKTTGRVIIAGHTDDIPISTARFRSNWELSAARSVSVVHHLAQVARIDQHRFLVEGHADTQPLAPNDSNESRARNRRVEIIIVKGKDLDAGELQALPESQGAPPAADVIEVDTPRVES